MTRQEQVTREQARHMVSAAKTNCEKWLSKAMRATTADEYTHCLMMARKAIQDCETWSKVFK